MLIRGKGTSKKQKPEEQQESEETKQGNEEAIPPVHEPIELEEEVPPNAFDEQVRQIFDVALVCQEMADEMYPVLEGIEAGSPLHIAIINAQVQCHVALFNAVINNAGSMVSALTALTAQFGGIPPGVPSGIASPEGGVILIQPPGGRR